MTKDVERHRSRSGLWPLAWPRRSAARPQSPAPRRRSRSIRIARSKACPKTVATSPGPVLDRMLQERPDRRISLPVNSRASMVVLPLHGTPEWIAPAGPGPAGARGATAGGISRRQVAVPHGRPRGSAISLLHHPAGHYPRSSRCAFRAAHSSSRSSDMTEESKDQPCSSLTGPRPPVGGRFGIVRDGKSVSPGPRSRAHFHERHSVDAGSSYPRGSASVRTSASSPSRSAVPHAARPSASGFTQSLRRGAGFPYAALCPPDIEGTPTAPLRLPKPELPMTLDLVLGAATAVGLAAYLLAVLAWPERF